MGKVGVAVVVVVVVVVGVDKKMCWYGVVEKQREQDTMLWYYRFLLQLIWYRKWRLWKKEVVVVVRSERERRAQSVSRVFGV